MTERKEEDFCFAVYHATDKASGTWVYCGLQRKDHEISGAIPDSLGNMVPYRRVYHDFEAEYQEKCWCGRTHPYPSAAATRCRQLRCEFCGSELSESGCERCKTKTGQ